MNNKSIMQLCSRQKSIICNIRSQHIARLGGAILYPSLHILGIPMLYYTPVCVGIHHIIRNQQIELLKYELKFNILKENYFNHKYVSIPILSDELSFHSQRPKLTNYIDNIIIKLDDVNNNKLISYKDKSYVHGSYIRRSYVHMPGPLNLMFDKLISLKRIRFRYFLFAALSGLVLSKYLCSLSPMIAILVTMIFSPRCKIDLRSYYRSIDNEMYKLYRTHGTVYWRLLLFQNIIIKTENDVWWPILNLFYRKIDNIQE